MKSTHEPVQSVRTLFPTRAKCKKAASAGSLLAEISFVNGLRFCASLPTTTFLVAPAISFDLCQTRFETTSCRPTWYGQTTFRLRSITRDILSNVDSGIPNFFVLEAPAVDNLFRAVCRLLDAIGHCILSLLAASTVTSFVFAATSLVLPLSCRPPL